jgi:hypothetical protein
MGDPSRHNPPGATAVVARYGAFTVERTRISHPPPARDTILTFLCLWAAGPDGTSERIIIQSGLRNGSWTLEFVARNAIIWLRNWERHSVTYPSGPEAKLRDEWRFDRVEAAVRDLAQLYPSLALEDIAYLTACSDPDPDAWVKLSPRERARHEWWRWDEGGDYAWESGERVERVLGERLAQVGAFDVHALRLRWPDGREETASWYEFILRAEQGPLRLLCTSWWGGAPGTVSLEPAKTVEDIEIWLGSMCLDIANGMEYAARFADEETRARIMEGVTIRRAQYDAVLPAWNDSRAAHPDPQIIYHDNPDAQDAKGQR